MFLYTDLETAVRVFNKLKERGISNLDIIPVGLDIENFKELNNYSLEVLKEKYQLPKDRNILVFVGRLEEYKNEEKLCIMDKFLQQTVQMVLE